MKNLLILLILGLAAYGGFLSWNQRNTATPPKVAEAKTEEPAPILRKEPTTAPEPPKVEPEKAKVEPEPPMPVAPAKRLAPEGVYYVVRAFSVANDDGVRGIRAGTPVKLVKDGEPMLRVTDGRGEFDARREYLTNDLDIAAQVSAQSSQQAAANAEWQQKQQALAAMNQEQNAAAMEATQQRVQQAAEANRAAAEQRAQRIAELRAQIVQEEAAKANVPTSKYGASAHQQHLNAQNEKIRQLQGELGRLGVAGAALERK